jgi:hypothetical protein
MASTKLTPDGTAPVHFLPERGRVGDVIPFQRDGRS